MLKWLGHLRGISTEDDSRNAVRWIPDYAIESYYAMYWGTSPQLSDRAFVDILVSLPHEQVMQIFQNDPRYTAHSLWRSTVEIRELERESNYFGQTT